MSHPLLRPLIQSIPTVAPVPHRSILSVGGSQANDFLNGLLTSSLHQPIKPLFSALLHAQGRVMYDVFLYTASESGKSGYLLEYDSRPSEAPPLLSLLKRYVLRSKVKIRDVSDQYNVWAAWGNSLPESPRRWTWSQSGVVQPAWEATDWPWGSEDNVILDRRAPGMGKRLLVRHGDLPQEAAHSELRTADAYTLHRILHGVPEGQVDIPPMQAFPMDSNLDVMGALEFRKGCYVGQELTVRTFHTGVIRKRILPVVIHKSNVQFRTSQILTCRSIFSLSHDRPPKTIAPSALAPQFAANLDIRPILDQETANSRTITRPRGTGKLLTSHEGLGLALLRMEHVEGVEAGHLKLQFDAGTGEREDTWAVSHWWPDWWPHRPAS